MAKPDFTRTSVQVERDILNIVDNIDRSLDSSSGESERKGHLVLNAFLSVLAVFASILGIQHFVGATATDEAKTSSPEATAAVGLSERDLALAKQYLQRTQAQSKLIRETKNRVAPAMPIDGNLDAIDNSMVDLAGLLDAPAGGK